MKVFHYLFYIFLAYILFSIVEYCLHRFLMHNGNIYFGKYHLIHHTHTEQDMTLNNKTKKYKELSMSENLGFENLEIAIIFVIVITFAFAFKYIYPIKLNIYVLLMINMTFFIYIVILWNSIHPFLHHKCPTKLGLIGIPYEYTEYLVKNSSYLRFLIDNHVTHHNVKGKNKGNYNVTLIGADFLFNTYNKKIN